MRNYKKESEWSRNKYEELRARIEKDIGLKFKEYLKSKNMTFADWLREKIKEELKL